MRGAFAAYFGSGPPPRGHRREIPVPWGEVEAQIEEELRAEAQRNDAIATLARNLAIAGALCTAFYDGLDQAYEERSYHVHGYRLLNRWRPGCGKAAP